MRRRSATAAPLPPAPSRGFEWSYTDEPHRSRRAAIAGADSAGVRSLLGPEDFAGVVDDDLDLIASLMP